MSLKRRFSNMIRPLIFCFARFDISNWINWL